ncbi:MAG: hypothetical protein Kow00133_09090 [Amphiplicatus sp.]
MADLDEVVDLDAVADHRVAERAAIDRRVRADFDVVADDHPSELGHADGALRRGNKAETGLADPRARQDGDPGAQKRVRDACSRFNAAVFADLDAWSDHDVRTEENACADLCAGRNDRCFVNPRVGSDFRFRMDPCLEIEKAIPVKTGGEPDETEPRRGRKARRPADSKRRRKRRRDKAKTDPPAVQLRDHLARLDEDDRIREIGFPKARYPRDCAAVS